MHFYLLLLTDLIVGVVLIAGLSTLLERTVLNQVLRDPVRSHVLSLGCAWFLAALVIFLMMPWRADVPSMFLVATIPVAVVQVRRGRVERRRIGYTREQG